MSQFESKNVECPYYIEASNNYQSKLNQIRCEGVIEGTTMNLTFRKKSEEKVYRIMFCNSAERCRRCRIHMMLDEKYEELYYGKK